MPEQYSSDSTAIRRDAADNLTEMHKIYAAYVARCRQANAMDFDDLLLYTFQLFFKIRKSARSTNSTSSMFW